MRAWHVLRSDEADTKRVPPSALSKLLKGLAGPRKTMLPPDLIETGMWDAVRTMSDLACDHATEILDGGASASQAEPRSAAAQQPMTEQDFREHFMREVTDTFSDELDAIRSADQVDARGVMLLAQCLESGINIFSDVEKDLIFTHMQ